MVFRRTPRNCALLGSHGAVSRPPTLARIPPPPHPPQSDGGEGGGTALLGPFRCASPPVGANSPSFDSPSRATSRPPLPRPSTTSPPSSPSTTTLLLTIALSLSPPNNPTPTSPSPRGGNIARRAPPQTRVFLPLLPHPLNVDRALWGASPPTRPLIIIIITTIQRAIPRNAPTRPARARPPPRRPPPPRLIERRTSRRRLWGRHVYGRTRYGPDTVA